MSDKMNCPGCGSYSSSILLAFEEGRACPTCGLSAAAALEIESVHQTRADQELKAQCETAILERDRARRELDWAMTRLDQIKITLGQVSRRLDKPLAEEQSPWE